jgi:ribonucleoside-diphosphate reductase alpha chain
MTDIYKELSKERKELQEQGLVPEWYTTSAWQMFKGKYTEPSEGVGVKPRFQTIAKVLAAEMPDNQIEWEGKFFDLMWKGWFSPSSPMLANTGTNRGCPVSCSGGVVGDSIDGFYSALHEAALLSKQGFGTSAYLGGIRPRGAPISIGGNASGTLPVLKDFIGMARNVSQGNNRRGSWAGYLEIDHTDFWEWVEFVHKNPDDCNIGWNVTDNFIQRLEEGDTDALARFQRALKVKAETGKGYFHFVDKANRANPPCYKEHGLTVKASNLCIEIELHADEDNTFTCVLGSMNCYFYDEWKDTDAVYTATIMLDCLCSVFIKQGKTIRGLEKAVRFTENGRALGLGLLGFHSYLQNNRIPFESLEAQFKNNEIFKHINEQSLEASKWMAIKLGEPYWCKGFGVRNTHRMAVAPNMSTAVLMGGISQGIEPFVANVFNQGSAVGELERINPEFLKLLKSKGRYTNDVVDSVAFNNGSCQHLDFLTQEEKDVFKTAYEINQEVILRLASQRQRYIDQGQSINLFFNADENEAYIAKIHKMAFLDPHIKGLYYMRMMAGVNTNKDECISCAG